MASPREQRRHHPDEVCASGRTVAERDRDRILFTTALRRLAGVTQVVAPDEGHVVHNRLTHVLEVAHIARRLAERFVRQCQPEIAAIGGLDPNVAEAAALAHDLGHPPFGHIAEEELDRLMVREVPDGYEGNAQSFRIVTKLAIRREDHPGLDLSRATLAAILKYPWQRQTAGKKHKKFGYYATEQDDFEFARRDFDGADRQSVEARIMDIADDIAYSVSDLEDFVRAGRIPFDALAMSAIHSAHSSAPPFESEERKQFLRNATAAILDQESGIAANEVAPAFDKLLGMLPIGKQYTGANADRARLRRITGVLMNTYIADAKLDPAATDQAYVVVSRQTRLEIALLKQLTWQYVIDRPGLALQQESQKEVIRGLYDVLSKAATSTDSARMRFLPNNLRESLKTSTDHHHPYRCIADFIAGMSDNGAVDMYHRLFGGSPRRPIGDLRL
jgi:dGTPase